MSDRVTECISTINILTAYMVCALSGPKERHMSPLVTILKRLIFSLEALAAKPLSRNLMEPFSKLSSGLHKFLELGKRFQTDGAVCYFLKAFDPFFSRPDTTASLSRSLDRLQDGLDEGILDEMLHTICLLLALIVDAYRETKEKSVVREEDRESRAVAESLHKFICDISPAEMEIDAARIDQFYACDCYHEEIIKSSGKLKSFVQRHAVGLLEWNPVGVGRIKALPELPCKHKDFSLVKPLRQIPLKSEGCAIALLEAQSGTFINTVIKTSGIACAEVMIDSSAQQFQIRLWGSWAAVKQATKQFNEMLVSKAFADSMTEELQKELSIQRVRIKEAIPDFVKSKGYRDAHSLDLVLVMDCTKSMDPWIDAAKKKLCETVDQIAKSLKGSTVRVGVVAFRDFVSSSPLESIDLTSDLAAVTRFITSLEIQGGGDYAEDVAGGFEEAMKMSWDNNRAAKCLIWVGDAPGHGVEYHPKGDGRFDSEASLSYIAKRAKTQSPYPDLQEQMAKLALNGFDFFAIEVKREYTGHMFDKLERTFKNQEALDRRARVFQRIDGLSGNTDCAKFFSDVIMRSASSSLLSNISSTIASGGVSRAAPVKKNEIHGFLLCPKMHSKFASFARPKGIPPPVPSTPSIYGGASASAAAGSAVRFVPAKRHTIRFYIRDLPKPGVNPIDWWMLTPYMKMTSVDTTVALNPKELGRGAMRAAYPVEDSKMPGKERVAKVYHSDDEEVNMTDEIVQRDALTQAVSKALAMAFSIDERHNHVVDFITTSYYELHDEQIIDGVCVKFFSSEPKITGSYEKYNNNGGYVLQPRTTRSAAVSSDIAQAFSHFTYEYTQGKLLVCDIQGHNQVYTDPQIHSRSRRDGPIKVSSKLVYGTGDKSVEGFHYFFASHICNGICQQLGLENLRSDGLLEPSISPPPGDSNPVELSCLLCGDICPMTCSEFRAKYNRDSGGFILCGYCREKDKTCQVPISCTKGHKVKSYNAYWYEMIGDQPPHCLQCSAGG